MKPVFFEFSLPLLGPVTFPAYMTMLLVGATAAIIFARRHAESVGIDGDHMFDLGILLLVSGIIGARLLAVLTDGHATDFVNLCLAPKKVAAVDAQVSYCTASSQCGFDYVCDAARNVCYPPRDCLAALKFWWGGLTYYGGFMLAVPAGIWYSRRKQLDVLKVADVMAPATMIGLFFGRIGCYYNGCCYGGHTDAFTGVRFPNRPGPVHPTQLYEGVVVAGLFAVLYFVVRPRKRNDGEVFAALLILYGLARTLLEVFRADPRGSLGPLSTSQLISIPMVGVGMWMYARLRRNDNIL